MGGPAQGARRPQLVEDGGLGRDRTRLPHRTSATNRKESPPPGRPAKALLEV